MIRAEQGAERYQFGPLACERGIAFRLWAPGEQTVVAEIDGIQTSPLPRDDCGFRSIATSAVPGARYRFVIDDQLRVPDPASRGQLDDVFGESLVPDPRKYRWRCTNWHGRPWEETVLYEVHVGLLGGFAGVTRHLPRLARLGITAIELMPIADFPGKRNWGYDGVLPFAPDRAYGTPDELKALIDDAHARNIMVFLDVVYNHFGPEGNWLGAYAPQFFRDDVRTPWGGGAIDFRQPAVRRFFVENALYWIHEFRMDGLRLDAAHAIVCRDWLIELAAEVKKSVAPGRSVHLILENDNNDADLLRTGFDAQWNDDFHHALHVLLTGEREGYYADYGDAPAEALARVLAEGFAFQGEPSIHRIGRARGAPSANLPPTAFVSFLQNHDQVGNRAFGERLATLVTPRALRAAVALLLLCPQIPLIFMGEEAGAREPFLYFTDFPEELAQAVREGRRAEFARFAAFEDAATRACIPDPNASSSFECSRPNFESEYSVEWNLFYSRLLDIRRERIVPHLHGTRPLGASAVGYSAVLARWRLGNGAQLTIAANFGRDDLDVSLPATPPTWGQSEKNVAPADTTIVWIEP